MKHQPTDQVEILRALVLRNGGPAAFAKKMSADRDNPIDPTFVSQILNGHRSFGDKARSNMAQRAGLPVDFFEANRHLGAKQPAALYDVENNTIKEAVKLLSEMSSDRQIEALGAIRVIHAHFISESRNPDQRTGT